MSSIQEFVPKFWVQYVFNLDFVLKFRIRIEVFVLDKAFLGFCFETCWLFVVFFCGVFSQACPKCLGTV